MPHCAPLKPASMFVKNSVFQVSISRSKAIGSILLSANAARAICPCSVAKGSRMFFKPLRFCRFAENLHPIAFRHPINFGFDRTHSGSPMFQTLNFAAPRNTHFTVIIKNRRFFHRQCVGFFQFCQNIFAARSCFASGTFQQEGCDMFRTRHIRFVLSNFAADVHHTAAVRADDFGCLRFLSARRLCRLPSRRKYRLV